MFVHPMKFRIGKLSHGEAFDQADCEMSHGIYDSELFGVAADASKPVHERTAPSLRAVPLSGDRAGLDSLIANGPAVVAEQLFRALCRCANPESS
jgi:hypothetical protein